MQAKITLQGGFRKIGSGSIAHCPMIMLGILTVIMVIAGCASVEGKFTPSTKPDIGFFANETIAIMSQADYTFERDETIYTREFYDYDSTEVKRLVEVTDEIQDLFQGIIDYSLDIVVVYETYNTDAERIAAYADSLMKYNSQFAKQLNVSIESYEAIIAEVRKQKKFIDAMKAAQSILNGAGWYMNQLLNEAVDATNNVSDKMEQLIDAEFAKIIHYQEILEEEKYNILDALGHVYGAYAGDEAAHGGLRTSRAIRKQGLLPKGKISDDDLAAINDHLMTRLDALHKISQEIEPDWIIYRATHSELDRLHDLMMNNIKSSRLLIIVWVHAHYQMASGIEDPAEWFDIGRTAGYVLRKGI